MKNKTQKISRLSTIQRNNVIIHAGQSGPNVIIQAGHIDPYPPDPLKRIRTSKDKKIWG